MTFVTRFAPSPTGPLHLGHAYSALLAYDMALAEGGRFLLRIEDIDTQRSKPEWETKILDDLGWLGVVWDDPVMRQSDRLPVYTRTLKALAKRGLVYPCRCNRRDIEAAQSAPQEGDAPLTGPDGLVYPGTCRMLGGRKQPNTTLPDDSAVRLWMFSAIGSVMPNAYEAKFSFVETGEGPEGQTGKITFTGEEVVRGIGDIVLARRGMGTSYHLSVVMDDAAQGITHVLRGQDLFEATKIHVVLQHVLGLPTPVYHHHKLIRDDEGKRLAKRDDARSLEKFRADGATPEDIRTMVGL